MRYSDLLLIQHDRNSRLEALATIVQGKGLASSLKVNNSIETLFVADRSGTHAFWVAPWDTDWIICFPGPMLFQVTDDRIQDFFEASLQRGIQRDAIHQQSGVEELSFTRWGINVRVRLQAKYAELGWRTISDREFKRAWRDAEPLMNCVGSSKGCPAPSKKWSLAHLWGPESTSTECEQLEYLEDRLLSTMVGIGDPEAGWYALDAIRASYHVVPAKVPPALHPWPVSPFPATESTCLHAPDLGCAWVSDLRSSVTVVGEVLLDAIEKIVPSDWRPLN